jgi:alkylated DNA nucleotide flippase Atl1
MNWQDLVDVLQAQVPAGSVTTYAQVSLLGYKVPNRNHPVRSLLVGARNNMFQHLTNRVVGVEGELADLPDGTGQQRQQLEAEGIPFTADGRVDFTQIAPVPLV